MADNVAITAGAGTSIAADEVVDGTLGTVKVQYVKIMDGTLDGTGKATVDSEGLNIVVNGWTNDYTNQLGRVKIVNDAGTVIDPTEQVAHDAADAGEPTKIGAKATDQLSDLTSVAQDDRTDLYAGLDGALIVRPHAPLGDLVDGTASATTTTATSIIAAGGAGINTYLTGIIAVNTSATDTTIVLDSGTTAKIRLSVPANGGCNVVFSSPLTPNAANEAWTFESEDAVTTMYVTATGFRSAV